MKCGDILLAQYPFTDGSASKLRPVLIVSSDQFNAGHDLVVLPISSQPDPSDKFSYYIDLSLPQFAGTGLRYSSAVKWTKPLAISIAVIKRRLGRLDAKCLEEVRARLRQVFS
jgi:mRNA interferase MazF